MEQNKKLLDIEEKIKQLKSQKQAIINKEKEKEAFKICQEKIKKHNLEMKLIDKAGRCGKALPL